VVNRGILGLYVATPSPATGVHENINNFAALPPGKPYGIRVSQEGAQRLPGAEKPSFLVWFEGHNSALAISPSIPRQKESESEADMTKILSWLV
jgi:hypothetical protein